MGTAQRIAKKMLPTAARRLLGRRLMDDRETLHEFWQSPAPDGNVPDEYIGPIWRSRALAELISDLPRNARILEVGCNVGRNLAYLHDVGYKNIVGVEISPHAVKLLRSTYPQLADADVVLGPAEDVLSQFADDEFELVFTMAVLEHIHPDSNRVFDGIARIGRQVLAIEPNAHVSHRQFPHDIPATFRSRGLRLVNARRMREFEGCREDPAINHYVAWRFAR